MQHCPGEASEDLDEVLGVQLTLRNRCRKETSKDLAK